MRQGQEEIYEILEDLLKLTEEEIDEIHDKNEFMYRVIGMDIIDEIEFYAEYGIKRKEMADICKQNPWFITESFERIRYIEKFLKEIGIESIRNIAVKYPKSMSINPIDIKNFVENKKEEGKREEEIRDMILNEFDKYILKQ